MTILILIVWAICIAGAALTRRAYRAIGHRREGGRGVIQKQDWKWFGNAGHLCVGAYCRFHLCTEIGQYVVSTVGQYWPQEAVREIFANSRGVVLEGKGDARERDYMTKIGYEEIGAGRTYETMVFRVIGHCNSPKCDCGLPLIDCHEQDCEGYNTARDATRGHTTMCEKWANR